MPVMPIVADVRSPIQFGRTEGAINAWLQAPGYAQISPQSYGNIYSINFWVFLFDSTVTNRFWADAMAQNAMFYNNATTIYHIAGNVAVNTAYVVTKGAWVNIGITRNGTLLKFFANGSQTGVNKTLTGNPNLAGITCLTPTYYRGLFDEFAIWSRELVASEMNDLYNSGAGRFISGNFPSTSTPMATGLLHLYHFDDGSGDSAADNGSRAVTIQGLNPLAWSSGKITNPSFPYTGTLSLPAIADVRAGVAVGENIGILDLPAIADVRDGTFFDSASKEGILDLPAESDVRGGVLFDNETKEGSFTPDYPSEDDVRDGVQFDQETKEGNLELPAEDQVLLDIEYGAAGTEFTGELALEIPGVSLDVPDNQIDLEISDPDVISLEV